MLMGMVDTIFADVAQPDQARIVALNASYFLKNGGHFVISIKASCTIFKLNYFTIFISLINIFYFILFYFILNFILIFFFTIFEKRYRFYSTCRGRLCSRGKKTTGRKHEATRAVDPRAL